MSRRCEPVYNNGNRLFWWKWSNSCFYKISTIRYFLKSRCAILGVYGPPDQGHQYQSTLVRRSLVPTFLHQLIGPYNTNNCLLEFIFNIPQIHCINILWFCIFFHIFMVFRCPNFGFPMVEYFVNFVNVGMPIIKSKKRPMKGKKTSANNCSNEFSWIISGDLNIRWQRPRH